ncbi:MoaD/ThiS family protein [Candidatus Poribacteria bacterium]|nr:MoaD/ThiS family protein [Candidatus Poribacteria bacterium]
MRIRVRFLGAFADVTNSKEEMFELKTPSVNSLLDHLVERKGERFHALAFDPATRRLRGGTTLLVNGQRRGLQHELCDGDEVTLLTPIAGG